MTGDKTNILVVDDLPEKLLVYQSILDELGQTLVTAWSGEETLGLVLRHDFAVILLDVQMPGMSGTETATLIRRRRKSAHTPIIFLTAFADEVRVAEGYAQGAVDFIFTPVVPDILRAKVRVFVDLYRMTQQVRRQAEEQVALAEERGKRAVAEEATRRSPFLADVSAAPGDSLDTGDTARVLARQAVPFLADLAAVVLAAGPAVAGRTGLGRPGRRWGGRPLGVAPPDTPDDPQRAAVERVLADCGAEHLDGLDLPYPTALDPAAPSAGVVQSAAVVPLRARGRILGAVVLAHGPSGRRPGRAGDRRPGQRPAVPGGGGGRPAEERVPVHARPRAAKPAGPHPQRRPTAADEKVPDHAEVGWAAGMIDRLVVHMVRLVDDLLDVSRITRGKIGLQPEPLDLTAVLRQVVEDAGPALARHRLEVDLPDAPQLVVGDRVRLTQVFANLLTNAAKYTDPGGRIRVTAERAGGQALVRVRDSGVGILLAVLAAVFDLFVQAEQPLDRDRGGLGIGLTLVRRLVELHGGTVEAHSDGSGRGSEFAVRLPLDSAAAAPDCSPVRSGVRAACWWPTTTSTPPKAWRHCCGPPATSCWWCTTGQPPSRSARTCPSWTSGYRG